MVLPKPSKHQYTKRKTLAEEQNSQIVTPAAKIKLKKNCMKIKATKRSANRRITSKQNKKMGSSNENIVDEDESSRQVNEESLIFSLNL